MDKRIFVKKRKKYNQKALQLQEALNTEYHLQLTDLELYIIYDIYNIDEKTYELAKHSVFCEITVDQIFEHIALHENEYFAYETLPAQYDQRSDSAEQCIKLLNPNAKTVVKTGTLVVFKKKLTEDQLKQIEQYLVNPIESRKKDLSILQFAFNSKPKELKDLTGFNGFSKQKLESLKNEMNLALHIQDLIFIQDYFQLCNFMVKFTYFYIIFRFI